MSVIRPRTVHREFALSAEIDWKMLRHKANETIARAYAPYSRFPVGAAGLTVEGDMVAGGNVENVSYGLGVCAEVSLVSALIGSGRSRLRAVSVCDSRGVVLMPCGRCRQVLWEFGGADLLVDHADGPLRLAELLPYAFGPDDLGAGTLDSDSTLDSDGGRR